MRLSDGLKAAEGDEAWLIRLVRGAMAQPATWPLRLGSGRHAFRGDLETALWNSGLLVGAAEPWCTALAIALAPDAPPPVRLHLASLARIVCEACGLLRRLRPGVVDDQLLPSMVGLLAAAHGEHDLAAVLLATDAPSPSDRQASLHAALPLVAEAVSRHAYLLGNPVDGLPLHALSLWVEARLLMRLTAGHTTGRGPVARRARRYRAHADALLILGIESLASELLDEKQPARRKASLRQLRAAGLEARLRREALEGAESPRPLAELAAGVTGALRPAFVAVHCLSLMLAGHWHEAQRARVDVAFGTAGQRPLAEAGATALLVAHGESARALTHHEGPDAWEDAVTRTIDLLTDTTSALGNELRETGDLATLLARSASGDTLSPDERRRVREQLIDLARAIPSLAIVAAPGGTLLLPLLQKILPFDLRPSSFRGKRRK